MKKVWLKSAMLLTGVTFALGAGGGCLSAFVQRILIAVAFD